MATSTTGTGTTIVCTVTVSPLGVLSG